MAITHSDLYMHIINKGALDRTLFDETFQILEINFFLSRTSGSFINKSDCHAIADIMLTLMLFNHYTIKSFILSNVTIYFFPPVI